MYFLPPHKSSSVSDSHHGVTCCWSEKFDCFWKLQWSWDKLSLCYKSPFLLRELALFSCIFPCAEATYFYKKLCLPKSLEETIFIFMALAVHESSKCLVTQLYANTLLITHDNTVYRKTPHRNLHKLLGAKTIQFISLFKLTHLRL